MSNKLIIRSITISPEGIGIEYVVPAQDMLRDGTTFNHMAYLPDDIYDEANTAIRQAAKAAVLEALASIVDPSKQRPAADEEDDDGIGPYEYPPG